MHPTLFFPPDKRTRLDLVLDDFPFPLALTYARLQEEMDKQEPIAAAWQLRDAFECLLKFTACIAVADFLHSKPETETVGELIGLLLKERGLSLGDWHALLELALKPLETFARANQLETSGCCFPGLFPMVFEVRKAKLSKTPLNKKISGNEKSFINWRNRVFGHGVFKQERQWYADETLQWIQTLHEFYTALRPILAGWELISFSSPGEKVVWQGSGELPPETRHQHEPLGEPLGMSLVKAQKTLEFGPLLSVQQCAICEQHAVFFFDKNKYELEKDRHRTSFVEYFRGHHNEQRNWDETRKLAQLLPPTFEWKRESYDG